VYESGPKGEVIASSAGGRSSSTLVHALKRQEKAYKLKLEYESLDQEDSCPTIQLRVILKPTNDTIRENLRCAGKPLPPATIAMTTDDVALSGEYAFPSDFIAKAVENAEGALEYDVLLDWPTADPNATYYLDVESRSDFLTGQLTFNLLYEAEAHTLKPLGRSQ
jgi:hypothetical protein